ncbi:MAG: YafY family transcriptional regulator [Clostridia bacterium]|nr:YafY family transcriptional regulator [Clostridia bacterium]
MKIDRLIGILTVLQQRGKVTAPYLAERFEVSRRTISRDIDILCQAGIPIVTTQGGDGGISLMEGFCLDTTAFTRDELSAILTGLGSLDSVRQVGSALSGKLGAEGLADDMTIDLSSFYQDDLADKISRLRTAIRKKKQVCFRYYYPKGEADKRVEPYRIVFKWSDWYLFGFCTERQDFRLYKLRRLWELTEGEFFEPRPIPPQKEELGTNMTDDYFITAVYHPSLKYRLVEEYGPHSFTVLEDGRLWTRWGFTNPGDAVLRFLSYGDRVEVLDPPEMRERMKEAIEKMAALYRT